MTSLAEAEVSERASAERASASLQPDPIGLLRQRFGHLRGRVLVFKAARRKSSRTQGSRGGFSQVFSFDAKRWRRDTNSALRMQTENCAKKNMPEVNVQS